MASIKGVREAADKFIEQQFGDISEAERATLLSDELFCVLSHCVDELKTQRFYGDEVDADGGDMLSANVNSSIDDLTSALYERRGQLLDDDDTVES